MRQDRTLLCNVQYTLHTSIYVTKLTIGNHPSVVGVLAHRRELVRGEGVLDLEQHLSLIHI